MPSDIVEAALTLKLRMVLPPAEIVEKAVSPFKIVMPGVGLFSVPVPEIDAAKPLLLSTMVRVAVSPGSSIPLLFPLASDTVILPKTRAGALMV